MRDVTRRGFVESIFVAATATLSAGRPAKAQRPDASKPFIDVHHHFVPPTWVSAYNISRAGPFDNSALTNWTPSRSVEEMDRQSVQTAIVSLSTPNVWAGDPAVAARVARITNEYAAKMAADHPGRFGFFASVPIADSAVAIAEVNHALDQLHADGIVLLTRLLGGPCHRSRCGDRCRAAESTAEWRRLAPEGTVLRHDDDGECGFDECTSAHGDFAPPDVWL